VSDLHLGLGLKDPRGTSRAFAAFLTGVVRPDAERAALVLLGDTFEVSSMPGADAAARLTAIAGHHPEVFAALSDCLQAGVELHFVVGNHDVGLARPAARRALRGLLDTRDSRRVFVHPWALHVPGVLFAEHGHQHHLVHRMPTQLLVASDDAARLPPTPLSVWGGGDRPALSRAITATTALLTARRAERAALSPDHRRLLDREAGWLRLGRAAGRDLWRVSQVRVLPALAGVAARSARRRWGRETVARTAPAHAAAVTATLQAHGAEVRWYVCGHTHRAALHELPGATAYLNAGTWCSDIRGPGPDRDDPERYPYVVIDVAPDGTSLAELVYWSHRSTASAPVEPTPTRATRN
jgi:UDP-2,3-diacylglucosamine pyrophosphatase LpxH